MNFKKFGKYTIIKKLASGGMADILLASDLSPTGFGRFVVIKRVLTKFSENEEFKDMFKNEGKVACNLKHRNITPIYEFGIEKNQLFLSMEYISGKNLRELVKKLQRYKGSISIPNSVHIIKEVASGLNYAHNAIDANTGQPLNLIHRDVSPQNIMLSFDGEIKLIDFGIAKVSDTNLTRAGHLKGKFSYMSPEQVHGEDLDERTDIFCLGIILWELLTGKRLFASKNELTSLKKIKKCDIPDAQKINPKIPAKLNSIVKKALSKNINLRYKTAAKLEQDLSVFLNKNYSEYSHYDFISLMKATYRKEIMDERENLKIYSSEFKKFINTLNIEASQIDLNIPNLSTLVETNTMRTIQTQSNKEANSSLTSDQSVAENSTQVENTSENQSQTLRPINQQFKENSSTLIQRQNLQTVTEHTEQNKSQARQTDIKTQPTAQKDIKTQPTRLNTRSNNYTGKSKSLSLRLKDDFKIMNQEDFLKSTHHSDIAKKKLTSSTFHTGKEPTDESLLHHSKKKTFLPLLFPLSIVLFTIFAGIYVLKKDNFSVVDLIKKDRKKAPIAKPISQKNIIPPSQVTVQNKVRSPSTVVPKRKIFISSKPSGAAIFVNDKFSSKYTPTLLVLPGDKQMNITLKKEGYFPGVSIFDPKTQKNNSLTIKLKADHQRKPTSEKIYIIQ